MVKNYISSIETKTGKINDIIESTPISNNEHNITIIRNDNYRDYIECIKVFRDFGEYEKGYDPTINYSQILSGERRRLDHPRKRKRLFKERRAKEMFDGYKRFKKFTRREPEYIPIHLHSFCN